MVSTQKVIRNDLVIVVRRMRKGAATVAVTQGPNAGHIRLELIINNNIAALVDRNPGPVQIQIVCVRSTSHRKKNMRADYFRWTFVASDAHGDTAVALRQLDTFRIQSNLCPLCL